MLMNSKIGILNYLGDGHNLQRLLFSSSGLKIGHLATARTEEVWFGFLRHDDVGHGNNF
jgi:hypothetical protein